ncbi:hypothetical protein HLASF_0288 [Halanaeroarchaeum sulfurireducens]|uniref:Uncharacterized protein n=1 Tax=Halanaeroarchaeum sulfurireducens TaxID=1604004 RepID=A0A0F7P9B6_9EURY|nr:hypothetical protein HLASF_0288 [Halanaeroarchaeum sulfurireducens]ALG81197.1 hypothetical protein HLASA_0287 [Halanaeroarchaeum sulfurireducens]
MPGRPRWVTTEPGNSRSDLPRHCISTSTNGGTRPTPVHTRPRAGARRSSVVSTHSTVTLTVSTERGGHRSQRFSIMPSSTRTNRSSSCSSGTIRCSTSSRPTSTGTTGRSFTCSSIRRRANPNSTSPAPTRGACPTTSISTPTPIGCPESSRSSGRTRAPCRSTTSKTSSSDCPSAARLRISPTAPSTDWRISPPFRWRMVSLGTKDRGFPTSSPSWMRRHFPTTIDCLRSDGTTSSPRN